MQEQLTISKWGFCVALWAILLLANRSQLQRISNKGTSFSVLLIFMVVFSTFGFITGDYFHYKDLYNEIIRYNENIHLEEFYFGLIQILPISYSIWRLAVWGLAAIVFALLLKRLNFNAQFSSLLFALILMTTFPNLRNVLGYIVLYYSVVLILFEKKNIVTNCIIGGIGIVCSFFLHKSMFMYILLLGIALVPFNKWVYIISWIAFPILYKYLYSISEYFLINSFANDQSITTGINYLNSDFNTYANLNGLIRLIVNRTSIILLLLYAIICVIFKKSDNINYGMKVFLQYSYILIYLSFLFYGQQVSAFFSSRFWDAALYPMTIFLIYYLYNRRNIRFVRMCLYFLIVSNLYDFAYSLYKL